MPAKAHDLAGRKFGFLTVLRRAQKGGAGRPVWVCRCVCGKEKPIPADALRAGNIASCGCQRVGSMRAALIKHGLSNTKMYRRWAGMLRRCRDKKSKDYANYGGRGIKVCARWEKFENFAADMGELPTTSHSIDRIDNNGHYEPNNCRWATPKQQGDNRRDQVLYDYRGRKLTLNQILKLTKSGVSYTRAWQRMHKHGWPVERAVG